MEVITFKINTGEEVSVNRTGRYTVVYKPIDRDAETTTPEITTVGSVVELSLDLSSLKIRNDDMSISSIPVANIIRIKSDSKK